MKLYGVKMLFGLVYLLVVFLGLWFLMVWVIGQGGGFGGILRGLNIAPEHPQHT